MAYNKGYYEKNRNLIKVTQQIYRNNNKDKKKEYDRNYYKQHKDDIRDYHAVHYIVNRPQIRKKQKKYYIINRECIKTRKAERKAKNPRRTWALATMGAHKQKGIIIIIKKEELIALAEKTDYCVYCHCELKYGQTSGEVIPNSPALDRRDNEDNITANNVDITCFRCGTTKGNRTRKDFIEYCRLIGRAEI